MFVCLFASQSKYLSRDMHECHKVMISFTFVRIKLVAKNPKNLAPV